MSRSFKSPSSTARRSSRTAVITLGVGTLLLASGLVAGQQAKPAIWDPVVTELKDTEPGSAAVVIGQDAAAPGTGAIAIGHGAIATGHQQIANGASIETTAVGEFAVAQGWRSTAIGAKAKAGVVSATAIGRGTYAWGPHMIAIGRGAYMEQVRSATDLNVQNACGIAGTDLFLGGMMAHKLIDRTGDTEVIPNDNGGDGKQRWKVRTRPPANYTIHGMDAFDARFDQDPRLFDASKYDPNNPETFSHRPDLDVTGGDLTLAAGRGTGTAQGGSLLLQTAPAGDKSVNRKNKLKTAVQIDSDYQTPQATPMWLWDNDGQKLKRVMVGPPNSGGEGFRALIIEN